MIPRKNGLFAGLALAGICVLVFLLARSGLLQVVTCDMCGQICQDYVEVQASPKSASVLNMAVMKDADTRKSASVRYTFCNECFEELQGAIKWHRQEKLKGG